jgi:hypothetical protein
VTHGIFKLILVNSGIRIYSFKILRSRLRVHHHPRSAGVKVPYCPVSCWLWNKNLQTRQIRIHVRQKRTETPRKQKTFRKTTRSLLPSKLQPPRDAFIAYHHRTTILYRAAGAVSHSLNIPLQMSWSSKDSVAITAASADLVSTFCGVDFRRLSTISPWVLKHSSTCW